MQATKVTLPGKGNAVNAWAFWTISILSLFLYQVPLLGLLLSPINTFVTMIHELSHAIVCLATGGFVSGLTIVADGAGHGGVTDCHAGMPLLYTPAGYLGTAIVGSSLIFLGQYPRISKAMLSGMGVVMGLASVGLVGMNVLHTGMQGVASFALGAIMSAFLLWAGIKWKARNANWLLLFLAIQTAMNSVTSIVTLVMISTGLTGFSSFSDAGNMAEMTGIPALVWSLSWIVISIAMVGGAIWITYGKKLIK